MQNYYPGDPANKPDVIQQIKEIDEERRKMAQEQQNSQGQIILSQDGKQIPLSNEQIVDIMRKQQEQLQNFIRLLQEKDVLLSKLQRDVEEYENSNNTFENNNSNKYKIQLDEETQRFSKVLHEKNSVISKLEQEVANYKKQNEEKNIQNNSSNSNSNSNSNNNSNSNSNSNISVINEQLIIEKDNKVIMLEKEIVSFKNTIDKLNILIDILNKK